MTATAARFDRSLILRTAWILARRDAAALSTTVRAVFGGALRNAWAQAKAYYAAKAVEAGRAAIAASRKSIVRQLDRAAARCRDGATAKQTWFLAGLMVEAGDDADDHLLDTTATLSRREASSLIDGYLKAK